MVRVRADEHDMLYWLVKLGARLPIDGRLTTRDSADHQTKSVQ